MKGILRYFCLQKRGHLNHHVGNNLPGASVAFHLNKQKRFEKTGAYSGHNELLFLIHVEYRNWRQTPFQD
ncbi:hypothetical protein D3C85_1751560 [compost metagenome]